AVVRAKDGSTYRHLSSALEENTDESCVARGEPLARTALSRPARGARDRGGGRFGRGTGQGRGGCSAIRKSALPVELRAPRTRESRFCVRVRSAFGNAGDRGSVDRTKDSVRPGKALWYQYVAGHPASQIGRGS